MPNFDAVKFAEWLNESYEASHFKSFSALADAAKLQRSTVSALANAKPQTLTNKASRPKAETVIALATVLNQDVSKALLLAGHAPQNQSVEVPKPIIEALAREGTLRPDDEVLIADFITRLKQTE